MMDSNVQGSGGGSMYIDKPSPDKLAEFLPWACRELQVLEDILVFDVHTEYVSPTTKRPLMKEKANQVTSKKISTSLQKGHKSTSIDKAVDNSNILKITALYDAFGNLIQLKFDKITTIDRMVFKIIGLILKYHVHLYSITIKRGMDYNIVHELSYFLNHTITDVCLDGSCVPGGHYDMLLENQNQLKNLSIARCNIDDNTTKLIAAKLIYPLPAAKTLSTLNLASNKITDVGAKHMAEAIRSNRCLVYLNLADNRIMDDGCIAILEGLDDFMLTDDEISETRHCYMASLKEKVPTQQEKIEEEKKTSSKKKMPKFQTTVSKKPKLEKQELKDDYDFIHPFSRKDTHNVDDNIYCYGNNQLAYLNISYNNLTLFSIKKLMNVIMNQKSADRKPRGLVNVVIEGNYIPRTCLEINKIDLILTELAEEFSKLSKIKKKISKSHLS